MCSDLICVARQRGVPVVRFFFSSISFPFFCVIFIHIFFFIPYRLKNIHTRAHGNNNPVVQSRELYIYVSSRSPLAPAKPNDVFKNTACRVTIYRRVRINVQGVFRLDANIHTIFPSFFLRKFHQYIAH